VALYFGYLELPMPQRAMVVELIRCQPPERVQQSSDIALTVAGFSGRRRGIRHRATEDQEMGGTR